MHDVLQRRGVSGFVKFFFLIGEHTVQNFSARKREKEPLI